MRHLLPLALLVSLTLLAAPALAQAPCRSCAAPSKSTPTAQCRCTPCHCTVCRCGERYESVHPSPQSADPTGLTSTATYAGPTWSYSYTAAVPVYAAPVYRFYSAGSYPSGFSGGSCYAPRRGFRLFGRCR